MRLVRVLASAAFAVALAASLPGCENTTEAVPKLDSAPAQGFGGGPAPKNQAEYRQQQQQKLGNNPYGDSYPGAR